MMIRRYSSRLIFLRAGIERASIGPLTPSRPLRQAFTPPSAANVENLFERYSEIDNSTEKRIAALRQAKMCEPTDEWIGTEKVHGANFGLYIMDGGKTIRYAKRSGIMPPSEHFFGYHALIPELTKQAAIIRSKLLEKLQLPDVHTIIVNGELFGGKYTHPNVPRSNQSFMLGGKRKGINAVQTDSFPQYSPNLHFYAFDIKYKEREDSEAIILTFDDATKIFQTVPDLLYARPIVRGTMDVVAAFDIETFQTTIPALVGMGNFPLKGNWAEGLVVKHAKRGTVGWDPKGLTILKFKCVAFQEITTDRSQGPRVDAMEAVRKASIGKAGVQLPTLSTVLQVPSELAACEHLLRHINDNRLKNVVSKMGTEPFTRLEVTADQLAMLLAKDALKDFLKEAEDPIVSATVHTRSEMARYVLFEAKKLVCQRWAGILARAKEDEAEQQRA
jgi:RNA-editing ligase